MSSLPKVNVNAIISSRSGGVVSYLTAPEAEISLS